MPKQQHSEPKRRAIMVQNVKEAWISSDIPASIRPNIWMGYYLQVDENFKPEPVNTAKREELKKQFSRLFK
jgi:hypothetical protein